MATTEGTAVPTTETGSVPAAEDVAMADAGLADDDNDNDNDDVDNNDTESASEPPGPRAGRLQTLFASSLQHTLAKVSWANFAACYPTAAARSPAALQTVHGALVARLRELCEAEFVAVLRARDVVRKLNALERLGEEARARRVAAAQGGGGGKAARPVATAAPVPPHTLPPETIVAAHLRPQRRAQRAVLAERLRSTQAANAARFAQLAAQQAEAAQLVGRLEQALADAAAAAGLLEGKEEEDGDGDGDGDALVTVLTRETRAAEVAME